MNAPSKVSRRGLLGATAAAGSLGLASAATPKRAAAPGADWRRQGDYLIRGGYVLTVDPALGDLPTGDVHVRGGRIVAVGARLTAPGAEVIDAADCIVMPGFVDTHWHMWNGLFRGIAHDAVDYFALQKLAAFYTPQDHYTAVRYAAAEALTAGLTTCHDWAHGVRTAADADAELRALADSGIRSRFALADMLDGAKAVDIAELGRFKTWTEAHGDGLVTLGLLTTAAGAIPAAAAAARRLGLKTIACHGDFSKVADVLGPEFVYTHGPGAPKALIELLVAKKVKVGFCPFTDPLIGAGLPPLKPFMDAGIPFKDIGFSIDVTCQTCVDPFASMRMLMDSARISARNAAGFDQAIQAPAPGNTDKTHGLMMPRQLVELATMGGARVLGLDAEIGSLTPGKAADLILVRTDEINMMPGKDLNPTYQLVMHAQPSNVDTVLVGGRIVKRAGRLRTGDVKALVKEASLAAQGIRRRANMPPVDLTL